MQSQTQINQTLIELIQGDITHQDTDAIVNAANSSLLGGGGVDGAIHRAAGPELLAATRLLGGCTTGDAKITPGYRLKARHVIHAVGPVYQPGDQHVPLLLASAYCRSLEVAAHHKLSSVAFPAISTGAYGYPLEEAANIALKAVCTFAKANDQIKLVRFALYDNYALEVFGKALAGLDCQPN